MGRERTLMKSKEHKARAEVSALLRQLADKLDSEATVRLVQGEQEIVLEVPDRVELQIKAEEELKGTRTQLGLQVEFQWFVGDAADAGGITLG